MLIPTSTPNILRDPNSKAILIKDDKAKQEWNKKMDEKRKFDKFNIELETLKQELNHIKSLIMSSLLSGKV